MSHAIYVRDIGRIRSSMPRLLAYGIKEREAAEQLVNGIAGTYLVGGTDPISRVKWFEDAGGLHELWVTPQ